MSGAIRMSLTMFVLAAAWLFPPFSHAQGWMGGRMDNNVFYLGAGVAHSKAQSGFCSDAAAAGFSNCDDKDAAWKITGGYQFHQNFGVELGYVDFGKYTASTPGGVTAGVKAKGVELLAVAAYPFAQRFSVYAKAGLYYWKSDAFASAGAVSVDLGSDKGTDWTFGLGLGYDITRNIAARLEWQRYGKDVDMIGIGGLYKFH